MRPTPKVVHSGRAYEPGEPQHVYDRDKTCWCRPVVMCARCESTKSCRCFRHGDKRVVIVHQPGGH